MVLTAEQKLKRKAKRKERLAKRKAAKAAGKFKTKGKHYVDQLSKRNSSNVPFNAPDLNQGNRMVRAYEGVRRTIAEVTKDNIFGLVSPFGAWERGVAPRVNDFSYRPTFTFASRYEAAIALVANSTDTTSDAYYEIYPQGLNKFNHATTFTSGIPGALNASNDPTYSGWSAFVDRFRQVGCEVKIRNTSAVLNIGGQIAIGRVTKSDSPANAAYVFGTWATSKDVALHSMGKPGDVFKGIWLPIQSDANNDWTFTPPATGVSSEDTTLTFWLKCPTVSAPETFTIEVITHYEAQVLPTNDQIYPADIVIGDPSLGASLLAATLAEYPAKCQVRTIETDDGDIQSVVSDVAQIYGAGKRVWGAAKKAWGWFKGLFAVHREPDAALRFALENGATFDQLRDMLALADSIPKQVGVKHETTVYTTLVDVFNGQMREKKLRDAVGPELAAAITATMTKSRVEREEEKSALLQSAAGLGGAQAAQSPGGWVITKPPLIRPRFVDGPGLG
jgi:hypothetical protein